MDRRTFVALLLAAPASLWATTKEQNVNTDKQATTRYILSTVIKAAKNYGWHKQPMYELMGHVGQLFEGTPYVGATLEGEGPEVCRIDLTGLDCVTFFENTLAIARTVKKGKSSMTDVIAELTFTRYRNGILDGYLSRLHYTTDWIRDNASKGVVADVTAELGGEALPLNLSFMSRHPDFYPALSGRPELTSELERIEKGLNEKPIVYIPQNKIARMEKELRTGDIIAVTTSKAGLDYAHTGLILRSKKGVARFLHASLQKRKVIVDKAIGSYVNSVKTHTGISVLRPLEL